MRLLRGLSGYRGFRNKPCQSSLKHDDLGLVPYEKGRAPNHYRAFLFRKYVANPLGTCRSS